MKVIKNIYGFIELFGIIAVACIFTFTLIFIQLHFNNRNKLNESVLGINSVPTPKPSSIKCIYPYSYGCGEGYPCCIGNCVKGQCQIPPPTPSPTRIPTPPFKNPIDMDINKWSTYTWSRHNISFKYPAELRTSENNLQPSWYWEGKHFWIDIYFGYNFDDPEAFLKFYDSIPGNTTRTISNKRIVNIGTHKGVMRQEDLVVQGYNASKVKTYTSFKKLCAYFTDESHYFYNVSIIFPQSGSRPVPITEKDRKIFESIISSLKSPNNPNIKLSPYPSYKQGCTSWGANGCKKSGKCCYGTCRNDKCQ